MTHGCGGICPACCAERQARVLAVVDRLLRETVVHKGRAPEGCEPSDALEANQATQEVPRS